MLKSSPQLYQQIEKSFETQVFDLSYLFFGEETFLVRQAVNYLRTMILHGCSITEFNDSVFDSSKLDMSRVLEELQTLPMMFSRRFIEIKNVEDLSEGNWKELLKYLANPIDSAVLLLSGAKLDKRKSSFLQAEKLCATVEFRKPFENQIPGWIRHIAKGLSLDLDDDALEVLHETVGSNLVEVEQELKKLQNYLGERKRVLIADIVQVVSQQKQWNVFELVDLVASRERKLALVSVIHLMDQGQNELGLISLLYRHYRLLRSTKQGEALGFSGAKLASFVQAYPRQLDQYVKQSRQFSHQQIDRAILLLAETEKAIKSSPLSSHLWIENLVLRLTDTNTPSVQTSMNR